jgi:hypothetical protein
VAGRRDVQTNRRDQIVMEIKIKDEQEIYTVIGQAPEGHITFVKSFLSLEQAEDFKRAQFPEEGPQYNKYSIQGNELDIYGMDELDYE